MELEGVGKNDGIGSVGRREGRWMPLEGAERTSSSLLIWIMVGSSETSTSLAGGDG